MATDFGGLKFDFSNNQTLHWVNNSNSFIIFMSIAMFNLVRSVQAKNRVIIYIIHENIVLRTYFRPAMWNHIYIEYGYFVVVIWVLIMAIIIFLSALVAARFYSATIKK